MIDLQKLTFAFVWIVTILFMIAALSKESVVLSGLSIALAILTLGEQITMELRRK